MPKTALEQWDETNANNTDVGSIDIDEGCAPSGMNNAAREQMSQIAKWLGDDTLASATTTDLGSVPARYVSVTGTTTITGLGTIKAGTAKYVKFTGALTLTHNATSLILPGAANITTAAGDTAIFVSEGSGNWRCLAYQRASAFYSRPQAWEHIETKVISVAAATCDFINLSAYRQLRLTGFAFPSSDAASLVLRTSTDNGSSYLATSTYINQVTVSSGTIIGTTRSTDSSILLSNSTGFDSGEGAIVNAFITQFNAATQTFVQNSAGGIGPTSLLAGAGTLGISPSAVNNALRLLFTAGNVEASSYFVLEGVRG